MIEPERVFQAENSSYHDILVYRVADDHAPAIVMGGVHLWQDSYVISAATARVLASHLVTLADEIESEVK